MGFTDKLTYRCHAKNISPDDESDKVYMRKELTLLRAIALSAGSIIGSGIFVSPKGVLMHAGSVGLSLILWVACGIFSAFGSLSYAEIGVTVPKSGGIYSYMHEAFGSLISFLFVWTELVLRRPTSQCIAALATVKYLLEPIFVGCDVSPATTRLLALFVLITLTAINCWSVTWAAHIQNWMFYIKLVALGAIIVMGFVEIIKRKGDVPNFDSAFDGTTSSVGEIGLAMYSGLFAYAGVEAINYSAEELKNVKRDLPRTIYISIAIVTTAYTLANIAYFTVLTKEEVLTSNAVAAVFAQRTMGPISIIMPIMVMCSVMGSLNSNIFTAGRLYFVSARDGGHMPSVIGMLSVHRYTPFPAMILCSFITSVYLLVFSDDIYSLLDYYGFFRWIVSSSGIVALVYLRWKKPDLPRPLRFPMCVHIVFLLGCAALIITPIYLQPVKSLTAACLLLSGIPVYFLLIYRKKKPDCCRSLLGSITRYLQLIMLVSPQDKSTYCSVLE
ncbi:PREDICTED: Y+L amino acid transporter 2-like isoform X1 [Priapulus caudatus]|uniref:Y+L amino acid transporter 2-like isoform X1 n=1 Tax=Priapulus caudatus TaxID=37621 RepID=A0ABM1ED37_PRICU|nr:PREDICTED: Y+L amino acid transporter 2-like isoform X1 [Priapulus caudatus]